MHDGRKFAEDEGEEGADEGGVGGGGENGGGVAEKAGSGGGLCAEEVGELRCRAATDDEDEEAELVGEVGDGKEIVENGTVFGEGFGKEGGKCRGGADGDAGELVTIAACFTPSGEEMKE